MMIPVHHCLRYAGTPDLSLQGVDQFKFLGHHGLFYWDNDNQPITSGPLNESRIRHHLEGAEPGTPVLLNLEAKERGTLRITDPAHGKFKFSQKGLDFHLHMLETCRRIAPDLIYGDYRQPDYWGGLILNRFDEWCGYVEELKPLFDAQDFSIPQFYFNETNAMWPAGLADAILCCERHFRIMRFVSPLTPIRPLLWWDWYDKWGANPHDAAMPGHVWRAILNCVIPRSDALMLWGGHPDVPWDAGAENWRILKQLTR